MASQALSGTPQDQHPTAVGEVLSRAPSWWDLAAALLVLGVVILLGSGAKQMTAPFVFTNPNPVSLSPSVLPMYAVRTTLRMLAALAASLLFTLTYATLAAKSRRAEKVLIPLLDVLQSVPVLGYLSFTVVFFVSLFPGNTLGPELAAIFAIFTSQAWNMAFSFYQSLRMVPGDLDEACRSVRSSPWQRFWRLEVPFAMPGLVWNTMMSMSGGWFFVVAAEAISVGDVQIALPGVGSYVARAIEGRDLAAVGWAIAAMSIAIILYDQLLFRPLVAWSEKFRFEQTAAQVAPRSWVLSLFQQSAIFQSINRVAAAGLQRVGDARLAPGFRAQPVRHLPPQRVVDAIWMLALAATISFVGWASLRYARETLSWSDVSQAAGSGLITLLRVLVLVALASIVWVPIGVLVGLRPRLTAAVQPIAQFLAAFPANLLFPLAV